LSGLDGPTRFRLEETSIWSFPSRGDWSNHKGDFPGNWTPYIPRNLIIRYTHEGDTVLDPFVGSGTSTTEAQLLRRFSIGVDINPTYLRVAENRIPNPNGPYCPQLLIGDARELPIQPSQIDLVLCHPPYSDIIKYSDQPNDLSCLPYHEFVDELDQVASECLRVTKSGKICALLMGDLRKKKRIVPLGYSAMSRFRSVGFELIDVAIKVQHNCASTRLWATRPRDFLLLAHEYLFVFRKP